MLGLLQWQHLWQFFGVPPSPNLNQLYAEVIAAYKQAHRHYHNQQHLAECLQKLAELRHLANNPAEIELALWFHDAIYDPLRHDNEQLSANWAKSSVLNAGLSGVIADRVYNLVMATQNHLADDNTDTALLLDADLAIMGATLPRFRQYEQQIRNEYADVPEAIFKLKRAEILRKFLAQPTVFYSGLFVQRYEAQARHNIQFALEQLCLT
jgi:predicted metal-dependent HD superfamily phosphohydrolase